METKYCNKCRKTKPISEFSKNKKSKDGLQTQCKECVCKYFKTYYNQNRKKFLELSKKQRKQNYKAVLEYSKNYKKKHVEYTKQYAKRYRDENKEYFKQKKEHYYNNNTEREKEYSKNWASKNRGKVNATSARRRARKNKATPPWITKKQSIEINEFYNKAKEMEKETGIKYHVDHIIPLKGKDVCGLHVPWNLQILTAVENIKKRAKY